MRLINIGCGNTYVDTPEWINIDIAPCGKSILACNIIEGLPFDDNYFNVVYHSNVLEHLNKEDGVRFIQDCYRILKPEGLIRIAVPDLEIIVKCYLRQMEDAIIGVEGAAENYDWIMIELIDQFTRKTSGGLMRQYLMQNNITNIDFISKRIGIEVLRIRGNTQEVSKNNPKRWINITHFRNIIKKRLLKLFLGDDFEFFKYAKFLKQGEVHQWMYDYYSLSKLLLENKFKNPVKMAPNQSNIFRWSEYNLDMSQIGPLKPDSLYIEARK